MMLEEWVAIESVEYAIKVLDIQLFILNHNSLKVQEPHKRIRVHRVYMDLVPILFLKLNRRTTLWDLLRPTLLLFI